MSEAQGTILVVDDTRLNRDLLVRSLSNLGYATVQAENGRLALDVLEAADGPRVDVILLDIEMPEMDGLEATRHIRAGDAAGRGVRIVAMTANALAGDREMCIAAGMNDYVSKPIRPADLAAALAATPSAGIAGVADA